MTGLFSCSLSHSGDVTSLLDRSQIVSDREQKALGLHDPPYVIQRLTYPMPLNCSSDYAAARPNNVTLLKASANSVFCMKIEVDGYFSRSDTM